MTSVDPFGLPPEQSLQWFREKGYALNFSWQDMWSEEHASAFTVAKATQLDVLADIRSAVDAAIASGQSLNQFTKDLRPKLQEHGWWGEKEVTNDETGEKQIVQLGSANRLRVIYETNLRQAHAAARWERIERTAQTRPYLRYVCLLDGRERKEHRLWHNTILPWDHPWWKKFTPPNGWGCRCKIMQLSERDLERYGLKLSKQAPPTKMVAFERRTSDGKKTMIQVPKGIDPSFDYNPGLARRGWMPPDAAPVLKPVKKFTDYGLTPAKQVTGRTAPVERWPIPDTKTSEDELRGRFSELFGGDEGTVKDPTGDQVLFSQRYLDHLLLKKESGDVARASFVPLAKQTAEEPFEIWLLPHRDLNTGRVTMRKRYIGLYDGRDYVLIADRQPDGYMAWTSYPRSQIDSFRQGQLLYAGSDPAK